MPLVPQDYSPRYCPRRCTGTGRDSEVYSMDVIKMAHRVASTGSDADVRVVQSINSSLSRIGVWIDEAYREQEKKMQDALEDAFTRQTRRN